MTSLLVLLLAGLLAPSPGIARPDSSDPLPSIVRRMDRYFQKHEVDGVTMDWRYEINPTEEIRQTVVCQVLGYVELYRLHPKPRLRREIVEHADFLLGRLDEVRSHGPFDGMLAYCLLSAYETTGEERFLAAGRTVADEMLSIPTSQCVLNGGLMVAMAAAADARLAGNAGSAEKARDIVAGLLPHQNEDGSFPHWCLGSRDIHYTGWMGMELIHIGRMIEDPRIEPLLARMSAFLEGRIAPDGRAVYEGPCPDEPDCTIYYYSRASGCDYDYDTRGWTVEPAYCALVFDHEDSPKYAPVIEFLASIENKGTFADMYGYWPPPDDPQYPWSIADTSAVNMSVMFWAFTSALTDRALRGESVDLRLDDDDDATLDVGPDPGLVTDRRLAIGPNPAPGPPRVRFTLEAPARASLAIFDAQGRCVRVIDAGALTTGPHTLVWDGRDVAGRVAPSGVYVALLRAGSLASSGRIVRVQ